MQTKDVIQQATTEYQAEVKRQLIEKYKSKLRERRALTFWQRIFPWKIIITRIKP